MLSHFEAASVNVNAALERLASVPTGTVRVDQVMGDAAMVESQAACATVQALLAINETLTDILTRLDHDAEPKVCPSRRGPHSQQTCMLPWGHNGKHESVERGTW